MPRFFGTPSAKSATIKTRRDLNSALRNGDEKMLLGYGDNDDTSGMAGLLGMTSVVPGVQTNRFKGYSDYLAAGTKQVWATARACDLKANVFISTEKKLIKRGQKITESTAVKPDPALVALLQNPNPFDTISELEYLWVWRMALCGNVFWLKDQMNGLGQPLALYDLNPRFMRIVPDAKLRVAKYIYRVNGHAIEFEADEIIHFRRPHANDPLWGLGEIEQGESLYDNHINRSLYDVRLMANGAFPTSMLVKEDFDGSPEDWELITTKFNDRYSGVNNTGKVAFSNGKWSVLKLGMDAAAMQEIEKGKKNIEEIFVNHGVPLSVAGFGAANFATARQDDMSFRRYAILPGLNLYADVMNSERGFIRAFDPTLKLDFALSGLVDVEQIMKDNGPLFDRGGVTPNDLRELCGLSRKSDPFLDQHFVLNNYVPIEVAGIAPDDAITGSNASSNPPPASGDGSSGTNPDAGTAGGDKPTEKPNKVKGRQKP
jgi:HK97 family phage portal protein